jgi:hypothetical protein
MTEQTQIHRRKQLDLASDAGAGVLGIGGLGALLGQWVTRYVVLLVVLGMLLHGWGMVENRRLEMGAAIPLWATAMYWLCWILLAGLLFLIVFSFHRG